MKTIKINKITEALLKESQKFYEVRQLSLSSIYESEEGYYLVIGHLSYYIDKTKTPYVKQITGLFDKDFNFIKTHPLKYERKRCGFDF